MCVCGYVQRMKNSHEFSLCLCALFMSYVYDLMYVCAWYICLNQNMHAGFWYVCMDGIAYTRACHTFYMCMRIHA